MEVCSIVKTYIFRVNRRNEVPKSIYRYGMCSEAIESYIITLKVITNDIYVKLDGCRLFIQLKQVE